MKNNEYLEAYLKTISDYNNKPVKKMVSKDNLKKSLIIQSKKNDVKKKLAKKLILQDGTKKETFDCHIDLICKRVQSQSPNQQQILAIPVNFFNGRDRFTTKQLPSEQAQQIKSRIKGMIDNAKSSAKLEDKQSLACFIILTEKKEDGSNGLKQFYAASSNLNKIVCIVPTEKDFFTNANTDYKTFVQKHPDDKLLSVSSAFTAFPLEACSAGLAAAKGVIDYGKQVATDLWKGSALVQWASEKMSGSSAQNFTAKTKHIILAMKKYKTDNAQKFKGVDAQLQNKILFAIGDEKGKQVNGLWNYDALIKNKDKISKQQYSALQGLQKQFVSALGSAQAYNQVKNDKSILDQISAEEGASALKQQKNNPQFKKLCKKLGFRDKKSQGGLAALFSGIFDKIFSLFGAGSDDTDPTQAQSGKIKGLMPFVRDAIKAIPPGKYPVFFGDDPSMAEMEAKFKELINNKK